MTVELLQEISDGGSLKGEYILMWNWTRRYENRLENGKWLQTWRWIADEKWFGDGNASPIFLTLLEYQNSVCSVLLFTNKSIVEQKNDIQQIVYYAINNVGKLQEIWSCKKNEWQASQM